MIVLCYSDEPMMMLMLMFVLLFDPSVIPWSIGSSFCNDRVKFFNGSIEYVSYAPYKLRVFHTTFLRTIKGATVEAVNFCWVFYHWTVL
jgi:hypothetical protein